MLSSSKTKSLARTLRDRFTPSCGGERHGGAVESEALDDLIAYLESL
jgi:hypothetical protein